MKSVLVRRVYFQCVHHYQVANWTPEKNTIEFGACFNPEGHGHEYAVEASVSGEPDPITGMILNLRDLDVALKNSIAELNGRHLNLEVPYFKTVQPTTENIAQYIAEKLAHELQAFKVELQRVRVYENTELWVDFYP